jgi:hypothetical protein
MKNFRRFLHPFRRLGMTQNFRLQPRMGDLGVGVRILHRGLNKYDVKMLTGFS